MHVYITRHLSQHCIISLLLSLPPCVVTVVEVVRCRRVCRNQSQETLLSSLSTLYFSTIQHPSIGTHQKQHQPHRSFTCERNACITPLSSTAVARRGIPHSPIFATPPPSATRAHAYTVARCTHASLYRYHTVSMLYNAICFIASIILIN